MTFSVFACSGGGCSACEGCGVAPIPGGFPSEARIDNSAQIRLTRSGLEFVESNIEPIIGTFLPDGLDFPIPPTTTTTSVAVIGDIDVEICNGGNCNAHMEIRDLQLTPTDPNRLRAHLEVIADTRNNAGARSTLPVRLRGGCTFLGCAINTTCQIDLDTRGGSREFVGFDADILFNEETGTGTSRDGYTYITLDEGGTGISDGQGFEDADVDIRDCSGISGAIIEFLSGFIIGLLVDQLSGQIDGLVAGALDDQLCTTQGEYGCPLGTVADGAGPDATCVYSGGARDGSCVPILLGADGRGDLGANFLGGFAPGAHGWAQFLLASGGQGEAVNEGMSLFMYGGFQSLTRDLSTSPGHNPCVPLIEPPPLPDVPRVESFRGNVIPGTAEETHLGIGLAEGYLDHAGYGAFDSGMLCIAAGTPLSQMLESGLVSALAPSLSRLTFPESNAPLSIAIRPQQPPDFTIGAGEGEPLINVALPQLQMDFYVFSNERFIRFMTFQTDLAIDIDLAVEGGEIVPMIGAVQANNSMVTNSEVLAENPASVAALVGGVISSFAGMFSSAISPIALPAIMGFNLEVPPGGIRGVRDGGHNFLGVFANLSLAGGGGGFDDVIDTSVELTDLSLDRESMQLDTFGRGEGNSVWVHFDASGPSGVEYEYSYRVDEGFWSAWTTEPRVQLRENVLLLQARHVIEARARVVGIPESVDETPARAELLIDILPPEVTLDPSETGVVVRARDIITEEEGLSYRFQVNGEWTEWGHESRLVVAYSEVESLVAEVRDEAGNVGRAEAGLIRGLPDPTGSAGCGCRVVGAPSSGPSSGLPLAMLGLLSVLGVFLSRRRRAVRLARRVREVAERHVPFVLLLVALPAALALVGCDCGGQMQQPCGGLCRESVGELCCPGTDMCVRADLDSLCDPGYECSADNVAFGDGMSCDIVCTMCTPRPALPKGVLSMYLGIAVNEAGEVAVSGYNPGQYGAPPSVDAFDYGDLMFGMAAGGEVAWQIIDGAPSSPITNDPTGWRDGVSAPGDDVGRWTSLVATPEGWAMAHTDVDNDSLRVGINSGGSWSFHEVDGTGSRTGYYSDIVRFGSGLAIAYHRIEPSEADPTRLQATVQLAVSATTAPASSDDWTIAAVEARDVACRAEWCGLGETCVSDGRCVVPTSDCDACGGGQACYEGSCIDEFPANWVEDWPPVLGLFVNLAVDSAGNLVVAYYDRSRGDLFAETSADPADWSAAPILIDGYGRVDAVQDAGDSGIGASLAVGADDRWHFTYVDGAEENLRYEIYEPGVGITLREIIDDGSIDPATGDRYPDGRHIVGDDSAIVVTAGDEVRVAYQDATAHRVLLAVRAPDGTWTRRVLDDADSTGFWIRQVLAPDNTSYIATLWRDTVAGRDGTRVLTYNP